MARLGLFGRIGKAIGKLADSIADAFTPSEPRRAPERPPEPPSEPPASPRPPRSSGRPSRQERRESDPYYRTWQANPGRGSYLEHRDFFRDNIISGLNVDNDTQLEYWQAYVKYMTSGNKSYRFNSVSDNPFWRTIGMHPDNFDWDGWKEAMGYNDK